MTTTKMTTTSSRGLPALLPAVLLLVGCGGDDPVSTGPDAAPGTTSVVVALPARFAEVPVPADNPLTVEGVALGKRLFFNPLLSVDSTVACASCHRLEFAFSDPERFSQGVAGRTSRQSMSLANLAWAPSLFWDGRAESLEAQVLQPVANPVEMGETWDHVEHKLSRHAEYPDLFEAAFPGEPITRTRVAQAIAQYERTLISGESRFDLFLRGDVQFTDQELLGWTVYGTERGNCFHCHGTILLTDNRFHNNGLDALPQDPGRGDITDIDGEAGHFRTPTLRNIELTAPYMHDGRFSTLEEVLAHYNNGFHRNDRLDPLLLAVPVKRNLSVDEQAAVIAFLRALTDPGFIEEHAQ